MKSYTTLITFISLLCFSGALFANADVAQDVQRHLSAFRVLPVQTSTNSKAFTNIFRATQKLIEKHGPEAILSSPGGKELLARQKRAKNLFRIKYQLADCGKSRRNLGERLEAATIGTSHCELWAEIDEKPIVETREYIKQVMRKDEAFLKEIKKNSYHDVIVNSAKTIWEYDRQFGRNNYPNIESALKDFCDLRKSVDCDDAMLFRKLVDARRDFNQLASYRPEPNLKEMTDGLNQNIDTMNDSLKLIKKEDGANSLLSMEIYKLQYQQTLSSGVGSLLLTESMQERVRGIRTMDDLEEKRPSRYERRKGAKSYYRMEPHVGNLKVHEVEKSYDELRKETVSGVNEIHEEFKDEDSEDFIKQIMKTHPASLGTTLLKYPEMAGIICKYIGEIEGSDKFWGGFKKVAIVGGIVLGTLAAVTVVGAGVSAALYTASAAAATGAAATTLAASASTALLIGGVATGVGFALGAGETALWAYESHQANQEYARLRVALMSKTTDQKGAAEAQAALDNHENAMQRSLLSGAFTAVDVLAFTKLARIAGEVAQVAGSKTMGKMSGAVNSLVDLMGSNSKINGLVLHMGKFFKNSDGAFGKLIGKLSGMKEGVMKKFLTKMSALSSDEIDTILARMFTCK